MVKTFLLSLLLFSASVFTAKATDVKSEHIFMYPLYNVEVIDGDTVEADIDLGFDLTKRSRIRIKGYDAPETFRPKSEEERQAGLKAKEYLKQIIVDKPILYVEGRYKDSFGRVLGYIHLSSGDCVSRLMKEAGYNK